MKKNYLLLALFICFNSQISFGQGIDKPRYQIITHRSGTYLGTINIELFPLVAPKMVKNFDSLVNIQFFDSTAFHRVLPGFVIQGGDPNTISGPMSSWGNGQPWQVTVPAEFSVVRHVRGILGAARDLDTNSANSQFYICVANALSLDGQYTVFGKVIQGMNIVDTIVNTPRDLVTEIPLQKIEMFVSFIGYNDTIPDVPSLIFPANNAQGVFNGNTFQWSDVDGAALYNIEVSTDSLFNNIIFGKNAGLNSTAISLLSSDSTYYWHVKSNNGGHESNYSPFYTFRTASAAQLLAPLNTAIGVSINPILQWTTVPNIGSYRLQIATSPTFTTYVINQGGIVPTFKQVNLLANTLYYWRVTYTIAGGQGFHSSVFSFTTGTTVDVGESNDKDISSVKIFPNPAHDLMWVNLYTPVPFNAEISLINIIGEVMVTKKKEFISGENNFDIEVSALNKGSYILLIKSDEKESYHKLEIN